MKISSLSVLVFLFALVAAVWAQQPDASRRGPLFPVLPRIADADPSVVHAVEVKIPTSLKVMRTPDAISVALDFETSQTMTLMVGKNMVTGVQSELRVYPEGTRPARPYTVGLSSGLGFNLGTSLLSANRDGIPLPGKKYTVDEDLAIFETDIPQQHMWSPTNSPNYKVLWRSALKQLVD
jgi:hypothetical protein